MIESPLEKQVIRIVIAGTKTFGDIKLLRKEVTEFLELCIGYPENSEEFKNNFIIEIVSGKARGADTLGEMYAKKRGYKVIPFRANWRAYGIAAGPIRNEKMAKYGTHCIIFRIDNSKGSTDMFKQAKKYKLPLKVVDINSQTDQINTTYYNLPKNEYCQIN